MCWDEGRRKLTVCGCNLEVFRLLIYGEGETHVCTKENINLLFPIMGGKKDSQAEMAWKAEDSIVRWEG